VELQGGNIFVNSKPGMGSDFRFRLTFLKVRDNLPEGNPKKAEIPVRNGKSIRVLVAEDNPVNQLLVNKVLQKHGFETDLADNGEIALNKYKKNDYDIILMDLQMPEKDGYETTHDIRSLKTYKKDIPIIAMTAHTIKGELERCIEIGMNDFISKPFNASELYEKIYKLVRVNSMVAE